MNTAAAATAVKALEGAKPKRYSLRKRPLPPPPKRKKPLIDLKNFDVNKPGETLSYRAWIQQKEAHRAQARSQQSSEKGKEKKIEKSESGEEGKVVSVSKERFWFKFWKGRRYNGLLKSEHLIAALTTHGPLTARQIWDIVKDVSGIESKRKMRSLLDWLKENRRIKTKKSNDVLQKSFYYHLCSDRFRNKIFIPPNYPQGLEVVGRPWRPPTPKQEFNPPPKFISKEMFPDLFPEARRPKIVWKPPPPPANWVPPPDKNDPKIFNPKFPFVPEGVLDTYMKFQNVRPNILAKLRELKKKA